MIVHRFLGGDGNPPCIVLHGLLGSSRNWVSAARHMSEHYAVYALDARNHGASPHLEPMDYPSMAADVLEWSNAHLNQGQKFTLVGHSMGGKTAMYFACKYPERLERLAVVDIAPKDYPPRWDREFDLMRALPLERLKSRTEAEKLLEREISDWAFRKFLVTNLGVDDHGKLFWTVDLDVIQRSLPHLFLNPFRHNCLVDEQSFSGSTHWIFGARSRFVTLEDHPTIRHHFPKARFFEVPEAGHNVHFDNPSGFAAALLGKD